MAAGGTGGGAIQRGGGGGGGGGGKNCAKAGLAAPAAPINSPANIAAARRNMPPSPEIASIQLRSQIAQDQGAFKTIRGK
jgi:hypothetical protein